MAPYTLLALATTLSTPQTRLCLSTYEVASPNPDAVVLGSVSGYHSGIQQVWFLEPTGALDHYYLKNAKTGRCVTTEGDDLAQRRCEGGAPKQVWKQEQMAWGSIHLRSTLNGKCATGMSFKDGGAVSLTTCGSPADKYDPQLWLSVPAPGTPNPPHDSGQGLLCDFCNPASPTCTETGAKCLATVHGQTICGRACSTTAPCPTGYTCLKPSGTAQQCVPDNQQCPYLLVGP